MEVVFLRLLEAAFFEDEDHIKRLVIMQYFMQKLSENK